MALSVPVPAFAGDLTGVRVSNYDGTSRIVLDMTELPLSWTKSYNEDTHTVTLNLANTINKVSNSVQQSTKELGVLKGISLQPTKTGLSIKLEASQAVNYHAFTLTRPDRVVVDLFSDYSQRTTKNINKSIRTTKVKTNVPEGLIESFAMTVDNDSPMVVLNHEEGLSLKEIDSVHVAAIGLETFNRSLTTTPYGGKGLTNGVLRYTPSRGYFVEPKQLAKVETSGGATFEGGTLLLHNGQYVGPKQSYNLGRTFIGSTKDESLVVVAVDRKAPKSVGVTLQEGAQLLKSLGAVSGFELTNQGSVDITVKNDYAHSSNDSEQKYKQILVIK